MEENITVTEKEKALIVGLNISGREGFEYSMKEFVSLVEACNMEPVARMEQNLPAATQALFIGSGKVEEVREKADEIKADVILFNESLSPTQLRNLQRELDYPILDRTALILEIFASRARTREAKMQVEVARLQYLKPRLVGLHASLGRQGGGSGLSNKGSGEKKIELDRRRITARIHELEKELQQVERDREIQRKKRVASGIPRVALVGYTNAGKSTLMNALVEEYIQDDSKKVFEYDMLFATLDTTVRKIVTENNKAFLLSDTVGFVSKLPHDLVKAFHSTLEEVRDADLLLQVVDYADAGMPEQIQVTKDTLKELGAEQIPMIMVYNKADRTQEAYPAVRGNSIYLSAKKRIGLKELTDLIESTAFSDYVDCEMLIPFDKGGIVSYFNTNATVKETEYLEEGVKLRMNCRQRDYQKYKEFVL